MTGNLVLKKLVFKMVNADELTGFSKIQMPGHLQDKVQPILFPALILKADRRGSPISQHANLHQTMLYHNPSTQNGESIQSTYNMYADTDNNRYHIYNVYGEGRRISMHRVIGNDWKTQSLENPKQPMEPVQNMESDNIPKNGKIAVPCPCGHTTQIKKGVLRARCSKCKKDVTAVMKQIVSPGAPVKKRPGRPPKAGLDPQGPAPEPAPATPVTPGTPAPTGPVPIAEPVTVNEPTIIEVPKQVPPVTEPIPMPDPGVIQQIAQTPAVPLQPVVDLKQPEMFTIEELKQIVHPAHLMEKLLVNQKAGRAVMDNEIVTSLDKSMALILNKVQEMYPDKTFLLALAGYGIGQATIAGALFLKPGQAEQPEKPKGKKVKA